MTSLEMLERLNVLKFPEPKPEPPFTQSELAYLRETLAQDFRLQVGYVSYCKEEQGSFWVENPTRWQRLQFFDCQREKEKAKHKLNMQVSILKKLKKLQRGT